MCGAGAKIYRALALRATQCRFGAVSQNHRELTPGKTGTGLAPRLRTAVIQIVAKPEKAIRFGTGKRG